MKNESVVIIGGGIAGLTAAIHLSRAGADVTVIEKHTYPRHKVCGEYISNEVLPYLNWLGVDIASLNPVQITRTEISTVDGKSVAGALPLGGFGISRYTFDKCLFETAVANGCKILYDTVTDITFSDDLFTVGFTDEKIYAKIVLGGFGKRSNIDQQMQRGFAMKKTPWLAVKAHYTADFRSDTVALHNFNGGYCGVSKVENDIVNICYLASYASFQKYKDIDKYRENVLFENPRLKQLLTNAEMIFYKPLTISQISFDSKLPVENHILMIGDSAGLINPLCGNGMAISIHSAKIASELTLKFLTGEFSRSTMESEYVRMWNHQFKARLRNGRFLAAMLERKTVSNVALKALQTFPVLLPELIKATHGKLIQVGV